MAHSILHSLLEWQELGMHRANLQCMLRARLPWCWGDTCMRWISFDSTMTYSIRGSVTEGHSTWIEYDGSQSMGSDKSYSIRGSVTRGYSKWIEYDGSSIRGSGHWSHEAGGAGGAGGVIGYTLRNTHLTTTQRLSSFKKGLRLIDKGHTPLFCMHLVFPSFSVSTCSGVSFSTTAWSIISNDGFGRSSALCLPSRLIYLAFGRCCRHC